MSGINELFNLQKEKNYLVCIDSDGCAIDTMEIKHRQCFGPKVVDIWELTAISHDVLEVWNFVNLYSKYRGINRFKGLVKVFQLLKDKKSVRQSGFQIPKYESIEKWVKETKVLSNGALEAEIKKSDDSDLKKALAWSRAVNESIANQEEDSKAFKNVYETLQKISKKADIIVVSSANADALDKEWHQHNFAEFVKVLAGQEMGSKTHCIAVAKKGRYHEDHVLMIGDAPGDFKAAKDNKVLYYPIIQGKEQESWQHFNEEAFNKFITGGYKGDYEDRLIENFTQSLSSDLPWE